MSPEILNIKLFLCVIIPQTCVKNNKEGPSIKPGDPEMVSGPAIEYLGNFGVVEFPIKVSIDEGRLSVIINQHYPDVNPDDIEFVIAGEGVDRKRVVDNRVSGLEMGVLGLEHPCDDLAGCTNPRVTEEGRIRITVFPAETYQLYRRLLREDFTFFLEAANTRDYFPYRGLTDGWLEDFNAILNLDSVWSEFVPIWEIIRDEDKSISEVRKIFSEHLEGLWSRVDPEACVKESLRREIEEMMLLMLSDPDFHQICELITKDIKDGNQWKVMSQKLEESLKYIFFHSKLERTYGKMLQFYEGLQPVKKAQYKAHLLRRLVKFETVRGILHQLEHVSQYGIREGALGEALIQAKRGLKYGGAVIAAAIMTSGVEALFNVLGDTTIYSESWISSKPELLYFILFLTFVINFKNGLDLYEKLLEDPGERRAYEIATARMRFDDAFNPMRMIEVDYAEGVPRW
jgi:hypothetical protein